jgi:putative ATPase
MEHFIPQEYLPDELAGERFYEPGPFAYERDIAKRLEWWAKLKERGGNSGTEGSPDR